MDLSNILKYILLVVAVLLVVCIALQNREGGVGTIFGGGGGGGEFYRSKRGIEKFLYISTIVLAIIFSILSMAIAILNV